MDNLERMFLKSNYELELASESFLSSLGSGINYIKEILASIINYIKEWHPIKRSAIAALLSKLNRPKVTPSTSKLFQLLETSNVGLLYLCDYDLRNVCKLERAMYELYYKFGVSTNPENTMHSLYLNYDLNSRLQNYVQDKIREWCRTNDKSYSRHQIITLSTRGNIISLVILIYDKDQNTYVEEFNFIVPEDKREIKNYIDADQLYYIAPMLLKSHLKSLDDFRWVTTKINKNLDNFVNKSSKSVSSISASILRMVNVMTPKFYILAINVAEAALGENKK